MSMNPAQEKKQQTKQSKGEKTCRKCLKSFSFKVLPALVVLLLFNGLRVGDVKWIRIEIDVTHMCHGESLSSRMFLCFWSSSWAASDSTVNMRSSTRAKGSQKWNEKTIFLLIFIHNMCFGGCVNCEKMNLLQTTTLPSSLSCTCCECLPLFKCCYSLKRFPRVLTMISIECLSRKM